MSLFGGALVIARTTRYTTLVDAVGGHVDTLANQALAVIGPFIPWMVFCCALWIIFVISYAIPKSAEYFGLSSFDKLAYFD